MDITLEFTRRLLRREQSGRASDRLSAEQIRQLGDALLPFLYELLLERPDEGLDENAQRLLSAIETKGSLALMITVIRRGRPTARRTSLGALLHLLHFHTGERGMWIGDHWVELPKTRAQLRRAPLIDHLKQDPKLKKVVFELRDSTDDIDCWIFSEMCAQLRWKDAMPFLRTMLSRVSNPGTAAWIRQTCETLEESA